MTVASKTNPQLKPKNLLRLENILFLVIVGAELILILALIFNYQLPLHDGFHAFCLQYYFLNNLIISGELPQWSPFMTHGSSATWWYSIQGCMGLLANASIFFHGLLKNINFVVVYYTGFFIDELLLLIGVWLLGKRYFSSVITLFFLSVSILGSSIWIAQPRFNFHLYYAIPLILYFFHRLLETGKWQFLFLAVNLFTLQSIWFTDANFIPIISLTIFLYLFLYFICNFSETVKRLKNLRWNRSCAIFLSATLITFTYVYALLKIGKDPNITSYDIGRNPDSTVGLTTFLTYGRWPSLWNWIELILRISPGLDYTLYIGILSLPLIYAGIITCVVQRRNLHFIYLIIVLLFFSAGTFVSVFFYYNWPLMKFYRHLSLMTPIIKLFFCFLAAFGFEAIFINRFFKENHKFFISLFFIIVLLMLGFSYFLKNIASHPSQAELFINEVLYQSKNEIIILFEPTFCNRLLLCSLYIFLFALLLMAFPFFHSQRLRSYLIIIILTLHMLDLYEYKIQEIKHRSIPLNQQQFQTTQFQLAPYPKRRTEAMFIERNPRIKIFQNTGLLETIIYWTTTSLLFEDQTSPLGRVDFWLKPLDQYMRAYWNQPINELSIKPLGLKKKFLDFPLSHPAILKISGITEDKIQFFSQVFLVQDEPFIANQISQTDYTGDFLFISHPDNIPMKAYHTLNWSGTYPLSSNMRLHLPYQILRFDSNHLELTVDVPSDYSSTWMMYADVWHPQWRAAVNGQPTPVFKANLAYKSILLHPGSNRVHFYFKSELLILLQNLVGLNALFWLGMTFGLIGKLFLGQEV